MTGRHFKLFAVFVGLGIPVLQLLRSLGLTGGYEGGAMMAWLLVLSLVGSWLFLRFEGRRVLSNPSDPIAAKPGRGGPDSSPH